MNASRALAAALATTAALAVGSPIAAAAERPNLLLVVTDDQRARGTLGVMPATVRWLGDGGRVFPTAYATTPLCCPSRASIFTGQYAHNHGVFFNQDPNKMDPEQAVQRRLHDAGYTTGIVGKYLLNEPVSDDPPNWDSFAISDGRYLGATWNVDGRVSRIADYATGYTAKRAMKFIADTEKAHDRRPWFLYVATGAPHGPSRPEAKYRKTDVGPFRRTPGVEEQDLSDKPPFWRAAVREFSPQPGFSAAARVRELQLRTLLSVDDLMADLRAKLERSGELEQTLVIFTSDNGLLWGEHGGLTIKDMPWLESSRIPMMLSWPGHLRPGTTDSRVAANIDLAPTLLDAANAPGASTMDGYSMLGPHRRRELLLEYFGLGDRLAAWSGIAAKGYQYTEYEPVGTYGAFREYYDLGADPSQLENLLGDASGDNDPVTSGLAARLHRYAGCAGASCP